MPKQQRLRIDVQLRAPKTAMPQTIGRYEVKRLLGEGGMGAVYLAEDPKLKRRVAIKVVRALGGQQQEILERFQREAEISAALNHANVITIHDVGEEPGWGPFIAMEYLEGKSLGVHLQGGKLGLEAKLRILIQTMRALRAAHLQGIVHRDVKPDNIFVALDGRVKLLDFGIARTMGQSVTSSGDFLGSPPYSAPELLKGEEPSPQTDRFAFAAMALEVLTGCLPHPGPTSVAILSHVLHSPPLVPPEPYPQVVEIFRKALDGDPDQRPDSLAHFVAELIHELPLEEIRKAALLDELARGDAAGTFSIPKRKPKPAQLEMAATHQMPQLQGWKAAEPVQILLDDGVHAQPQDDPVQPIPPPQEPSHELIPGLPFDLKKALMWTVLALLALQAYWWVSGLLKGWLKTGKG